MMGDDVGTLEAFADSICRVADVEEVERQTPDQGTVKFRSPAAPDNRKAWSEVYYRGRDDNADDLRLYLGIVPEDEWEREELKDEVERVVNRHTPDTERRVGAGVVIADGMVTRILSQMQGDMEGLGVTVESVGLWPAAEMVQFIGDVQSDALRDVLTRR